MAHIVFVINDLVSVRNAIIDVSKRLINAGHQVTIASSRDQGAQIEAYDIPYLQLPLRGSIPDQRTRLQKWRDFHKRRDEAVIALNMDEAVETMRAIAPDLIVIESEMAEHVIAFSQLDVPLATHAYFPSIYKGRNLPPMQHDIVPNQGLRGTSLGIRLSWWVYHWQRIRTEIRYFLGNAGLYRLSVLRHLAKKVGFDFRREASIFHWLIPVVFTRLPHLYLHALEFDFPHTPRDHIQHLGALLNHERIDTGHDTQQLDQLLHTIENDPQRKVIYCAFGSLFTGDDSPFIERLISAVKNHPEWTVIISMGARRDDEYTDVPEHVHIFSWVDQLRVLEVANAIVMHAGIGTIMECIYHDVPMLSYPFAVNDQPGTGARIHYHQVGIVGNRQHDSPQTIEQHIEHLLNNPLYHENIAKMQTAFARYTPEHTVQVFEALLKNT